MAIVVNDGTKQFNASEDGRDMVVGRCQHISWREKRTKVKILYQNGWLQVFLESPYGENMYIQYRIPLQSPTQRFTPPPPKLARLCFTPSAPWERALLWCNSRHRLSLWSVSNTWRIVLAILIPVISDNHDIFSWVTYNLDPWKQPSVVTDQHAVSIS